MVARWRSCSCVRIIRVCYCTVVYQQRAQQCKGLSLPSIQLKHGAVMTPTSSLHGGHAQKQICLFFFGITFTSSAILPTIDQSEAHAIINFKICLGKHAPRPSRETLPPLPCEPPQNYPSYAPDVYLHLHVNQDGV